MTDSLFLMQRYWGSDEENEELDGANGIKNLNVSEKSKKKRQKLDLTICEVVEIDNDIEVLDKTNAINGSFKNPTKKVQEIRNTSFEAKSSKKEKISKGKKHENAYKETQENNLSYTQDDGLIVQNSPKNAKKEKKKQKLRELSKSEEENELEISEKYNSSNSRDLVSEVQKFPENSSKTEPQSDREKVQKKRKKIKDLSNSGEEFTPYISEESNLSNSVDRALEKSSKIESPSGKVKTQKKKQKISKEENKLQNFNVQPENTDGNFSTIGKIQHQKSPKVKQTLPNWLSNPTYISVDLQEDVTPINELNYLDSNTIKKLQETGIGFLFPVQLAIIPWLMQSKEGSLLVHPSDICVSAPTGSGKTLAFVLPIVQSLKNRVVCSIRALIVLPVNELAIQVYNVFETFTQGTDLKVALLIGQKAFITEQNMLVKCVGNKVQSLVDIVVTSPGRVLDHILRTRGFCLKRLRYLVIDEADRMMEFLQQGWLKQVEAAVFQDCRFSDCVCGNSKRLLVEPTSAFNFGFICQPLQKLLFSATLTHDPEQLHSLALYKPKLFTASMQNAEEKYTGTCTIPDTLTMAQTICDAGIKPIVICHLMEKHKFKKVLCFTQSVERAHRLHLVLEEMGLFQVREISSFNRAVQRKIALQQFVSGKVNILVCSDLVARGIDIENVDCVISYDVPQFVKNYIHRIGRTARAGKSGMAVTLLSQDEIPKFKKILKSADIVLPKTFDINSEDLKPLITPYQKALSAANEKLKNEKSVASNTMSQKKRKRNQK